jgi:PDDEXK-like domain of unknown function (DUF3799)
MNAPEPVVLAPGIHDIRARVYHADPCVEPSLSASIIKILLGKSPLHAWKAHPRLNPQFRALESAEFDLGSGAHSVLLQGGADLVVINPADYPAKNGNVPQGWTNDAIREARDSARAAGKIPVLRKDHEAMLSMAAAADIAIGKCADLADKGVPLSLADGDAERTLIWQEGNIWCRARLDWMSRDRRVMLDYKSTTDASPDWFSRQIVRMEYHIQDSFYRRGLRAITGQPAEFIFVAQENQIPFDCSFHAVDPSLAEIADALVERAIRLWGECLKTDTWPGYSNRIHWAVAQGWQMAEHEARMADDPLYNV